MFEKFSKPTTHVIEVYAYSDEYPEQIQHEVIANTDAAIVLMQLYQQEQRLIYADEEMTTLLKKEAQQRKFSGPIINLAHIEGLAFLSGKIKRGDSILLIGQGELHKGLFAGRDASALIELLSEDLELVDKNLHELDLHSCKLGRLDDFCDELRVGLKGSFKLITTYTELCSVSIENGRPRRYWIKLAENEDTTDQFYTSEHLGALGIRRTESTEPLSLGYNLG